MEYKHATDVFINELTLVTKTGETDLRFVYAELNIFDSIFKPAISGNITIVDAVGLNQQLILNGTELLLLNIGKTEDDVLFKKAFRVYKQTDRKPRNDNSEVFVLHFVSEEAIFSEQIGINQFYRGSYSEIASSILIDYLEVPATKILNNLESSQGIKDLFIPDSKPLQAVNWCAKRAVNSEFSPSFLFFENLEGFNFITLASLLSREPIFSVTFDHKNAVDDPASNITGAEKYKVDVQFNMLNSIRNGVYAGKFKGFDFINRVIASKEISYADHLDKGFMKDGEFSGNKNPNFAGIKNRNNKDSTEMYGTRTVLSYMTPSFKHSKYIQEHSPSILNTVENTEDYIFQRNAIFNNLINQQMSIALAGRFDTFSGVNLNINALKKGVKVEGEDDDSLDESLKGKKLVTACRHMIRDSQHHMILELSSGTTDLNLPVSTDFQEPKRVINYDTA